MLGTTLLRSAARIWWLKIYVDSGRMPVPRDSPSIVSGDPSAHRVLLIGNGAAGGWGVLTHGLALAGRLADVVTAATGRCCDVDQVGDEVMTAATAHGWLRGRDLAAYDAVLVVLGLGEALRRTPADAWHAGMADLLGLLRRRTRPGVRVVVAGIEPVRSARVFDGLLGVLGQRTADRLEAVTRALVADSPGTVHVPLPAPGATGYSDVYAAWAEHLGPAVADALAAGGTPAARPALVPLAAPPAPVSAARPELQALVDRAKTEFGADVAWVGTVDGDRYTMSAASIGNVPRDIPLDLTFCAATIEAGTTTILPDTRRDPRFAAGPFVDVLHLEFYAGAPVHSADGATIGTFCVASIRPRRASSIDADALADYARRAEAELAPVLTQG